MKPKRDGQKWRGCNLSSMTVKRKCDHDPSPEKMSPRMTTSRRQVGVIIWSRATCYEQGEYSNKYFLNVENSRGKKSSIRKIFKEGESSTSNPQLVMKDPFRSFYSDLYEKSINENSEALIDLFEGLTSSEIVTSCNYLCSLAIITWSKMTHKEQ